MMTAPLGMAMTLPGAVSCAKELSSTDHVALAVTSVGVVGEHGVTEHATGARQFKAEPVAESHWIEIVAMPVRSGAEGLPPQRPAPVAPSRAMATNRVYSAYRGLVGRPGHRSAGFSQRRRSLTGPSRR